MEKRIRKVFYYKFNMYKDIETRLEKMALKGLFLEKIDRHFWTFIKAEPKKVKYTVTYFSDGSLFDDTLTENQIGYIEKANASGWKYVAGISKMQIFVNEDENPKVLDADQKEKFENIKECMKKSYVPTSALLIAVLLINIVLNMNMAIASPTDFFTYNFRAYAVIAMIIVALEQSTSLFYYLNWCKKTETSLASGGGCIDEYSKLSKVLNNIYIVLGFVIFGLLVVDFITYDLFYGAVVLLQLPVIIVVMELVEKYLKKKKRETKVIRASVIVTSILCTILYIGVFSYLIVNRDKIGNEKSTFTTVEWELTPTETKNYKLYNDEIPVTCDDLYGEIDYDYYSYRKAKTNSLFLSKQEYYQRPLPQKNAPPAIEYSIVEPKFDFIYDAVEVELKEEYSKHYNDTGYTEIDNDIFGTVEAYQLQGKYGFRGTYLLFYEDKIVQLRVDDSLTDEQIEIIIEGLEL